MTELNFYTLDVFTDTLFGGNPLAVVFGGENLEADRMQTIAAEFNLSETVFVLPPERPASTRRVRIFTPKAELPFAGHPTIGTACLLASLGECHTDDTGTAVKLELPVGDVAVSMEMNGSHPAKATMNVPVMPSESPVNYGAKELAQVLGLTLADFDPDDQPCVYSCGTPFVFVRLASIDAVSRAGVRHEHWEKLLGNAEASMLFVFSADGQSPDVRIHARMFAPSMGIAEDPATGSAVSALAGLLSSRREDGQHKVVVEQGVEMGRPSILNLEYECRDQKAISVQVGGSSVLVSEGKMTV